VSLIPEFELGLWNAWIFVLLMFSIDIGLPSLVIRLFLGSTKSQEINKRHSTRPELSDVEKKMDNLSSIILIALIAYSIVLPFQFGTVWFYIGLFVFMFGLILGFVAMINFALAPWDKPVTKGVYAVSRNPMYFGMVVIFVSTSIACASWLFLLLTMVWLVLVDRVVVVEERLFLKFTGNPTENICIEPLDG
jgi:protein-S-isoprenylcysteine O-methyltransferase Ste14